MLTLVRRLCAPLAFLHGQGIVHRDLKPDNIFVRPDATPVLVDFGLTTSFTSQVSRESFELAGVVEGTAAYMSPEQIRGEFVDARADLYALGCILYELITGRKPFLGRNLDALLSQHLEAQPIAPSRLVDGVPPQLETLILSLLKKDRRERIGQADAVAAVLESLGADPWPHELPRPLAYLYRPGFAGRDAALEPLRNLLQQLEQHGALALVGGESGIGKTRLAMELAREAAPRRVQVLFGECLPQAGVALQSLQKPLQHLADRCLGQGVAEAERLFGLRGKALAPYAPFLAYLPGQKRHPEPAELAPEAGRRRLFAALTEVLEAFTVQQPLLLVLDDLQWVDELTLGWLQFVLRSGALRRMRLLILGTYRTEEVTRCTELEPASPLQAVIDAPEVCRIDLGRLDESAVAAMVSNMLAIAPPPAPFVQFLARQSEGNPFFAAEYLRTAVAERLLLRDVRGRWILEPACDTGLSAYERLPLPVSIQSLVGRRLAGLGAHARSLLELGAVFGREFDLALMPGIAEASLDGLSELTARQVLEETAPGHFRFLHDKLREGTYDQIDLGSRRALHRAVAEALEGRPEPQKQELLAELGRHWELAGIADRARPFYLAAAQLATSRYAYTDAERLYRSYFGLLAGPTPESIEARNAFGRDVLHPLGQIPQVIAEHDRALAEARQIGSPLSEGRSLLALAIIYLEIGRLVEAVPILEEALVLSRSTGDHVSEARILGNLATLHDEQGRPHQAVQFYREAIAIARETCNLRLEGILIGNFANLHKDQGKVRQAMDFYGQALAIKRKVGNRKSEAMTLMNLATLHEEQLHFRKARGLYEQSLAILQQIADQRSEAIVLTSLANLVGSTDPAEADRLYDRALAIHRNVGNRQFEGITLRYIANTARRAGNIDRAELVLPQAEHILLELGYKLQYALCICERGFIALARRCPAGQILEQVEQLAVSLAAGPGSGLGREVGTLRRAVELFRAGQESRLFGGESIQDLPRSLQKWLLHRSELQRCPSTGVLSRPPDIFVR